MKRIFTLIIFCLVVQFYSLNVEAAITKVPETAQTEEITSSEYLEDEYYKVRTPFDEDYTIYVEGKTKVPTKRFAIRVFNHVKSGSATYYVTTFVTPDKNGEFSVKINTEEGNSEDPVAFKGTVVASTETYGSKPGYNAVGDIPAGMYHLTIARATTDADADVSKGTAWYNGSLGGKSGYCYKEALLEVKNGENNNLKLVEYPDIISENQKLNQSHNVSGSDKVYLDVYMKDLKWLFTDPKTNEKTEMTASRVEYIKKVADSITKDAETDYEKLLKIYEYVAENIYYDRHAYEQKKYQYDNPYLNLLNLRNDKESANSTEGKVATTCQGYAAMVIILARAEGIPARIVNGHHISSPLTIWSDKMVEQMGNVSHWWAQAYVDGRWIFIDANAGSGNIWKRTGFSDAGTWEKKGLVSYIGFDESMEQMSCNYYYLTITDGEVEKDLLTDENEITKLRTFLNIKSSGVTNGKRLNSKYSSKDMTTWGTGKADNLVIDSSGRVTKINWNNKKLYGSADFRNMKKLKTLSVYTNKLTKIRVGGCSSLTSLYGNYNDLTTFDGTATKSLKTINLKGNKFTSVKFWAKDKNVTVNRKTAVGSFGFSYVKDTNKITIYAEAKNIPKNYNYLKIYDGNTLKKTINVKNRKSYSYSFKPKNKTCSIKYTKKK